MKFFELTQHLESAPGLAGAIRVAWQGKTHITLHGADLYFVVGDGLYQYAFSFDDLTADDWELV